LYPIPTRRRHRHQRRIDQSAFDQRAALKIQPKTRLGIGNLYVTSAGFKAFLVPFWGLSGAQNDDA